jgi:protein subunit release factor B
MQDERSQLQNRARAMTVLRSRLLKLRQDEQEAQARDEIAKMLLGNEVANYNGNKVLSWKQQEGRAGFDATKFKAENPELAARYEKQGQPYRVMRTHQTKEKK